MGSPSNALNISQIGFVYFDGAYAFDGRAPISTNSTIGITVNATTMDVQITGLTNHNILVGGASSAITNVAPSATSGVPLISQGAAADPAFGTAVVAGGGTGQVTLTNHGVLIGAGTTAITQLAAGSAGQVLQSGGASADPAYSTAVYPSTAGTSGKILISNGTNIVSSTPTFPNASASSGKFIQSDGTNWIASTPTLPTTGGTTGTILRSNGTNFTNTTATYPSSTTVSQILYSSATNTIGGITTGNDLILGTDSSGVPSMKSTFSNNYTFTSSTGARALTISSSEATLTTSDAILKLSVANTSTGDPYTQYSINGTISYASGVDNLDSQSYKIVTAAASGTKPSTGTVLKRITSGGNRTLPLNGCVLADLTTTITDGTGDGTTISPVIFSNDGGNFFDQNGNYDPSTGLFTAAVTGKYLVSASVALGDLGVLHTGGVIKVFTSAVAPYGIGVFNPGVMKDANNQYTAQITMIISMAAAATLGISIQVSGSTKTVDILGNNFGSYSRLSINLIS